jgi:AGCS family alanine or glycine:cation symporter
MDQASLVTFLDKIGDFIWGWPLLGFIFAAGLIMTVVLKGIQFRYFTTAWSYVLFPPKTVGKKKEGELSPFQAFINALSASMGNGSLAGMAVAVAQGGPGVAFWILVLGAVIIPIRYAEVYASSALSSTSSAGSLNGGPMAYLRLVPGGSFLPFAYAFCLLLLVFVANGMQCNSMSLGVCAMTGCHNLVLAFAFLFFLVSIMLGGAQRIVRASELIVPVKVGLFFVSAGAVLIYNYAEVIPSLLFIVRAAFEPKALFGAATGFTVQYAISAAASRVINASEVGLGTAGVLFGATKNTDPVRNGIMSMVSAFISNYCVCFVLALCFVVTKTWDGGAQSTEMTIAAFSSVFGALGGWIVTFLSLTFGMGVLVAYAFIGRECWIYLFGKKSAALYSFLYCAAAFFGTIAKVDIVWASVNIVNAGLLFFNIYGLLFLLPRIARGFIVKAEK